MSNASPTAEECDGIFWYLSKETTANEETILLNSDYYTLKGASKVERTETGYKYNVLLFNETTVEYTKAVLGDPKGYIDRMSKIGYGGLIVKVGSVPTRTVKNMMKKILDNIKLPESEIKTILKQV